MPKASKTVMSENPGEPDPMRPPARNRLRRIAVYKNIVGRGHERVLEIGCGPGDLTYALRDHARSVIGVDLSAENLRLARMRKELWLLQKGRVETVEFIQMHARELGFPGESFDYVVSTSMIEHLQPNDVQPHLEEVRRVLKSQRSYLVWCPNRLGHHKDRAEHLSMLSYAELMEKMRRAGFREFCSPLFNSPPMVDTGFKVFLERVMSALRLKILWSHLGVRNILLLATK